MDISCRAHNEGYAALPAEYVQPRWYAAYTCANHEKRVAEQARAKDDRAFLAPLYACSVEGPPQTTSVATLSGLPLYSSGTSGSITSCDQGVVNLVGFSGMPKPLAEEEVEDLTARPLAGGMRPEPYPYLPVGQRVRIVDGPLTGREGILKRWKGNLRVVLSVELIQRSILADVDFLVRGPRVGALRELTSLTPIFGNKIHSDVPNPARSAQPDCESRSIRAERIASDICLFSGVCSKNK